MSSLRLTKEQLVKRDEEGIGMKDLDVWRRAQLENGWIMPTAPWWKRLPIIRNIRAACLMWRVESHYSAWGSIGAFGRSGYDEWVIWGIANGFERKQ